MDKDKRFAELLGRSSLGSQAARELRERTAAPQAHAVRMIADLRHEIATADPETAEHAADELARLLAALRKPPRSSTELSFSRGARLNEDEAQPSLMAVQYVDWRERAREVEDLAPVKRLALRADLMVVVSIRWSLLRRLLHYAFEPSRAAILDLIQFLDRAYERDVFSVWDRTRIRALVRELTFELDPVLSPQAALNVACGLAFDHELERGLVRGLDPVRYRDLLTLTYALNRIVNLDDHRWSGFDLAHALDLVDDLVLLLDEAVCRVLGIQQAAGLGTALLNGALDDFTRTDLSAVNLAGIDLVGVRWSLFGTRWPPSTDVERLTAESREIEPRSDVFVVVRVSAGSPVA